MDRYEWSLAALINNQDGVSKSILMEFVERFRAWRCVNLGDSSGKKTAMMQFKVERFIPRYYDGICKWNMREMIVNLLTV